MSEKQKKQQRIANQRRSKFILRVETRIRKTLGPFFPAIAWGWDPHSETITSYDPHTKKPSPRHSLTAHLFASLPKQIQRRFIFLTSGKREPSAKEYRTLERQLLGKARQRLTRELRARIQRLPHRVGHQRGFTKQERRELLHRVKRETKLREKEATRRGEIPRRGYKDETVREIAKKLDLWPRHIWRLIRDA